MPEAPEHADIELGSENVSSKNAGMQQRATSSAGEGIVRKVLDNDAVMREKSEDSFKSANGVADVEAQMFSTVDQRTDDELGLQQGQHGASGASTRDQRDPSVFASAIDGRHNSEDALANEGIFLEGEPEVIETPDEHREAVAPQSRFCKSFKRIRRFLGDYHMPLLLLLALISGILWPLPGKTLGDVRLGDGLCVAPSNFTTNGMVCVWTTLSSLCVTIIFVISGLNLDLAKMRKAITARREILLGLFMIFGVTSAFGFAIAAAPKLDPPEFSFGLALFSLMPTTMSSCVIIVGYAGGNVALALLLTISSNVLAVAILPLTVLWLVQVYYVDGGDTAVRVDAIQLCLNLVFQVVVPLVIAVIAKRLSPNVIGGLVKRHTYVLKVTSATLNAVIPWLRISQNAKNFSRAAATSYVVVILCAISLHLLYLSLSTIASRKLVKLKSVEEEKAVVFIGAQKTLPIALSVLELLPTTVTGDQGLVLVPMVFMYLFQAIFDSIVAVRWSK